jgi:hypothetical protein
MISSGHTSVGTAAVAVDGVSVNPSRLTIHNQDNSDTIYIGGAEVTTSTGLGLVKLETIQLELQPLEQVYVVSSKSGHTISWLRQTI